MEFAEPFLTPEIEPVKAKFKAWAEDFIVEEIPLYPPLGYGGHLYLWVEKKALNTPDIVQALSEMTGAKKRDIGYAGLKDKQSVSRQWISIPAEFAPQLERVKLEGLAILRRELHRNKLRVGHLAGNRFVIMLRGTLGEAERARAAAVLEILARRGMPNWFGKQRFSRLDPEFSRARALLASPPARKLHWEERFALNALQSLLFNRVLAARMEQGLYDTMLEGDVAVMARGGSQFVVDNLETAAARRATGEIFATGPMAGPEMIRPRGAALAFETAALAGSGLEDVDFNQAPLRGDRRPLCVPLRAPQVELVDGALRLSIELPAGAYATNVVREILKVAV